MKKRPIISLLTDHPRLVNADFKKKLAALGTVKFRPGFMGLSEKARVNLLSQSDIAVIGWGPGMLPVSLLQQNYRLKYICHMTGELKRYIPLDYFKAGIRVTNWGNSLSFATAEGTLALLLSVIKQIPMLDRTTRQGRPDETVRPVMTLKDMRVGLYGLGPIGRQTARLLRGFGPSLSFYDPTIKKAPGYLTRHKSLKALFKNSDIVSVHAGLNNKTHRSITRKELGLMPDGSVLINTARGPIVKEADLARALKSRRLYAGIEVIDDEDNWKASPLMKVPNVIFSGHKISRIGTQEMAVLQQTALDNIKAFINKKPLKHSVTLKRYRIMT